MGSAFKVTSLLAVLLSTSACTEARLLSEQAIEQRKIQNDIQARATYAALCDLSLGAVQRSTPAERQAVLEFCNLAPPKTVTIQLDQQALRFLLGSAP